MKRSPIIFIFLGAAALVVPLFVFPDSGPDELTYTFEFPAPSIVPAGVYDRITLEGCESWQVAGRPIVPFQGAAVLIPEGKEITGVSYETDGEIVLPGSYYLEPAGAPYPLSRPDLQREVLPDPEIYASSLPYPGRIVSEENSQRKSGYRILFFNLYPVSYLPREGRISYYTGIRVTVALREAARKSVDGGIPAVRGLAGDREAVARLVLNPESIRSYRPVPQKSGVNPADSYSHVIITGSALAACFEPLRDHRIDRGLSSAIVTVEDIVSNPDYRWDGAFGDGVAWADDTAARIRNFIRDAYQNRGTEYVLLGGTTRSSPSASSGWSPRTRTPGDRISTRCLPTIISAAWTAATTITATPCGGRKPTARGEETSISPSRSTWDGPASTARHRSPT